MKRVVRLLGVGLLLLVVLLLILFVLAQTTPLISAQDEHAVWLRLLITAIVICLLSMCIFFLFSFRQNEASTISLYDAPRDKCTLSCAINGIHAAFHYLKKNYISGCVMTVPTGW